MKYKDQQLLEEAYGRILLKESPDGCISPDGKILDWYSADALTFGFISADQECEIYEIDDNPEEDYPIAILKDFGSAWKDRLYIGKYTHCELFFDKVLKDLLKSPQGIIERHYKHGQVEPIDVATVTNKNITYHLLQEFFEEHEIHTRMMMLPAGRIWTKGKVISFYADEGQVTPQHIEAIFKGANILQENVKDFYIEFLGDVKPTRLVIDYMSTSKQTTTYSPEEQKEREKRKAEAMAKAHEVVAVGTKDKDVQKIIDDRKKALQQAQSQAINTGKVLSLADRQKMFASESTTTKSTD